VRHKKLTRRGYPGA